MVHMACAREGRFQAKALARQEDIPESFLFKILQTLIRHGVVVSYRGVDGGYQLAVAMDIFRGRYRRSFEHPEAIEKDKKLTYVFALPMTNHVFQPGHRIMVQIQSSWFPLYDRNPQTFVSNIFWAKPEDYRKAVQRVYHAPGQASFIELPLVRSQ